MSVSPTRSPSTETLRTAGDVAPGDAPLMEWRVWLARRQPLRAVAVAAVILAASGWALFLFHSALAAALTALALTGAVAEFLFPIRYRLTRNGAEARNLWYWRHIAWRDVRRVGRCGTEIKLSPLRHGGRREAFRGVLLRCDENLNEVLALVEQMRAAG